MSQQGHTLGQRIRARRRALFMTQAALGEQVGVSQSAVGQWERDEIAPSLRVRPALAGVLRVYPADFFDEGDRAIERVVHAGR